MPLDAHHRARSSRVPVRSLTPPGAVIHPRRDTARALYPALGTNHLIAWRHDDPGGRALYPARGHTIAAYREPLLLVHVREVRHYALGRGPAWR